MNLAVILPTINLWGGVKRFLELGNMFISRGHSFTVYTPEGVPPPWFDFHGTVKPFAQLHSAEHDALFFTEAKLAGVAGKTPAKKRIFYHVLQKEDLRPILQIPDIIVFVNSTNLYQHDIQKYRIRPFKAIGGVNFAAFTPKELSESHEGPFTILTYGRLTRKRKGTRFVVRAVERLYKKGYDIRLLLFDTPLDEHARNLIDSFECSAPYKFVTNHPVAQNNTLFHQADLFASAERSAGWANTCAEAMAAGLPVVATESGTRDFLKNEVTGMVVRRNSFSVARAIRRLIESPEMRVSMAAAGNRRIRNFDWSVLADRILRYLEDGSESASWG